MWQFESFDFFAREIVDYKVQGPDREIKTRDYVRVQEITQFALNWTDTRQVQAGVRNVYFFKVIRRACVVVYLDCDEMKVAAFVVTCNGG